MPTSIKLKGIPVPRAHEVLLLAGLCVLGWWGWSEFSRRQVRQRLWNPEATVVERDRAIEAYAAQGAAAVPELIEGLASSEPRFRFDAAQALGRIGEAAADARPALLQARRDPEPIVRKAVIRALALIAPDAPETIDLLVNTITSDDDFGVRDVASCTIDPSALPKLISQLGNMRQEIRREVIQLAHRVDRDSPEFVATLWRLEDDPDPIVRDDALLLLMQDRRAPLERVLSWLHESNPNVAKQSLECLSQFESDRGTILPELCCFLESSEPSGIDTGDLKSHALDLVTHFGTDARPAIPSLVRLLNRSHGNPSRIHRILTTLVEIGADRETLIPILVPLLDEIELSGSAGQILAQVAEDEARRQAGRLVERLRSTNAGAKNAALNALVGMRAVVATSHELAALVPELTSLLTDRSAQTAYQAAMILGAIGPNAADAVPAMIELLDREETLAPGLPTYLTVTLGSIGPAAAPAASRLLRFTTDPRKESWRWKSTVIALTEIGVRNSEFVANLSSALGEPSVDFIPGTALESLAALRVRDESLLPQLRNCLEHRLPSIRAAAAWSIVDIAGNTPEVVAALTERLRDPSPTVRMVAATALGKLGPAGASARRALEAAAAAKENENPVILSSNPRSWTGLRGSELPSQSLPQAIARTIEQIDEASENRNLNSN